MIRLTPTLTRQCWLFAVGSAFFAVATAPRVSELAGAGLTNLLCFVGSWFFTTAAWMQQPHPSCGPAGMAIGHHAVRRHGAVQHQHRAALLMQSVPERRHLRGRPTRRGSLAFLVSGALAVAALDAGEARRDTAVAWINMAGCVAFGLSAGAAFVRGQRGHRGRVAGQYRHVRGRTVLLVAALAELPRFRKPGRTLRQSPA